MSTKKVIAAMSGGVDSSVAAAIYKEQGYEVIGVTLRLRAGLPVEDDGCASKEDEAHAAEAARLLGIQHQILDYSDDFKEQVLRPSWDEFARGRTPNPCTLCNPRMKFGKLLEYATQIGAEKVITGHYAIIREDHGIFKLERGSDPNKDQTYFLYALTQEMLGRIHFPIGEIDKSSVREYARKTGLRNHAKKDSQDACFNIPGESFQESLRKIFNKDAKTGRFITPDGKAHGSHKGIHQYTIGQRKGLGIALGFPAYVYAIDASSGDVSISTDPDDLMADCFEVVSLNWQSGIVPNAPFRAMIQVRYRSRPTPGLVTPHADGSATVLMDKPLRAITTGQAAVFYDDALLLGGGCIDHVRPLCLQSEQ
jgi:tRNA-specific 2-thiouridylase